MVNIIQ